MRIGTNEVLIILLVALIIFGPQQLPKLGKMFGKTMKSFQEGVESSDDEKPAATTENKASASAETSAEKKTV